MSESDDPQSRTEEATEKKILDSIEQGKVPVSRDLATAFSIFSFLAACSFFAGSVTPRFAEALGLLLANVGALPLPSGADALQYARVVGGEIARVLTPMAVVFLAAGLAASFAQGAPRIVYDRIQPDLSRISVRSGWKRVFGAAGLVELFKSMMKMTIVGGAVVLAANSERAALTDAMSVDPVRLPALTLRLIIHLSSVVAIAVGVLACADFVWTRFKWRRDLRMSRQELKEELKQAEGDPFVKARMRSLAMDRARRRMMAAVPKATLVVVNPTHYAVALRYVREEGGAPLVLAKGRDLVALKIREIAENNNVPVFEKKELARAMFDLVEVDRMIPPEFYRPVAELIHFLYSVASRR